MPTPHLPERLLRDLAERSSVREQAALLVAAGHLSGPAVLAAAAGTEPDLFEIELAIARAFAERAVRGARRGGSFLRAHVEDLIDAENSRTAVLLARGASARPAGTAFIPGGRRITAERFARAATAPSPEAAGTALAAVFDGEPEAKALRAHALDPARLDAEMERSLGGRLRRAARQDTLGPAPLLLYLHRLGQQLVALGEIIWVLDLGTTPAQPGLTAGGAVA
jgi:vacuolar-type H+-ATPase subunit C/Vma6